MDSDILDSMPPMEPIGRDATPVHFSTPVCFLTGGWRRRFRPIFRELFSRIELQKTRQRASKTSGSEEGGCRWADGGAHILILILYFRPRFFFWPRRGRALLATHTHATPRFPRFIFEARYRSLRYTFVITFNGIRIIRSRASAARPRRATRARAPRRVWGFDRNLNPPAPFPPARRPRL